jgi:hypothetical protein
MHKLAVAFFYACAILSIPVTVHAVARAGMAKAEFQRSLPQSTRRNSRLNSRRAGSAGQGH